MADQMSDEDLVAELHKRNQRRKAEKADKQYNSCSTRLLALFIAIAVIVALLVMLRLAGAS